MHAWFCTYNLHWSEISTTGGFPCAFSLVESVEDHLHVCTGFNRIRFTCRDGVPEFRWTFSSRPRMWGATMYASADGRRAPGRSRTLSDPGQSYVTPPYTIQWPAPVRQDMGMTAGMPYHQSPSRSSSLERTPGDPFLPHPGSLLAQHQISNSPGATSSSAPVSPRSPSPQRSGHQRSSSRQGSIRAPQGPGPLIRDVPQPPRTSFNVPTAVSPAGWGQGQGVPVQPQHSPALTSFQSAGMQRQGSHHSTHQQPPANVHQDASATHLSHHHSGHHHSGPSHQHAHHRSRSRPPSAASHRYASSITPPVYGHGSSVTSNASRVSLNGGVPSHRNHYVTSPPPGMSTSHHPDPRPTHMPSGSPQRSRSHTRVPPPSTHGTTTTTQSVHMVKETLPSPLVPALAANEIRRTTHRPALPANYDGQTQTRYVNMLLALDRISPIFNILASFFTWILLAGFLLFPGTFASWKDAPAGTPQSDILSVVNNTSL